MNTFVWGDHFMTGISEIDNQHRTLVDIINKIGDLVVDNKKDFLKINSLLDELMSYTKYHFEEEEKIFLKVNGDKRHFEKHVNEHTMFIEKVVFLSKGIGSNEENGDLNFLLTFLIHWLAYHILVTDQNLARQVASIESGISPEVAFEIEEKKSTQSVEPLLSALHTLLDQVTQKNNELFQFNKSLEIKVQERTKELERLNIKLEKLSLSDELTNIANRRLCMQVLNDFWKYENEELSCIMIDVDYFKKVNDTYGHDAGDKVLCMLSQLFVHTIRSDDTVCRLGGDEFLIICQHTNIEGAKILAQEILDKVNELKIRVGSGFWHGSVSIGIASKNEKMSRCEELIKAADDGVYTAKHDGKNCIRVV